MWQTIAILIIGLAVVAFVVRAVLRLIKQSRDKNMFVGCSGCPFSENCNRNRDSNNCNNKL